MKKLNKITSFIFDRISKNKSLVFFVIFLTFIFVISVMISNRVLISIPKKGGEINEIILNSKPRFINPVLSISLIDKDLVSLIYSPLLKIGADKKLKENIASYKLLKDKKTYRLKLKKNIFFQDGEKMTIDDVIFTIKKIQDPLIKSPHYSAWIGVETKKIDDYTLEIKLKNEYYQFINNLVLYILPKHLWKDIPAEEFPFSKLNIQPVGSGPFQVKEVVMNEKGEIEKYILNSFNKYWPKEAYLDKITFHFFENREKYEKSILTDVVDKTSLSFFSDSKDIIEKMFPGERYKVLKTGKEIDLFLKANSKNKNLSNKDFRKLIGSIIKNSFQNNKINVKKSDFDKLENYEYSKSGNLLLNKKEVALTLSFFNDNLFNNIANNIKNILKRYGIKVILREINNRNNLENIIRNRDFEIIIFGYDFGIIKDLFYFFHSSQADDPGVNVAGIKNKDIDKILLELRKNLSYKERDEKIEKINEKIEAENLFISLYSLQEFYKLPQGLKNFENKIINSRENRFDGIENWYLKEEKVLPFLIKNLQN